MSYPLNPDDIVFMDLETRSRCNLRREGGRRYAEDPSTEILTAVFIHQGRVVVWVPAARPGTVTGELAKFFPEELAQKLGFFIDRFELFEGPEIPDAIFSDFAPLPWAAHNANGFDKLVWQNLIDSDNGGWIDTIPLCRLYSLPSGLDAIGSELFGAGKDSGKATMLKLSMPMKRGPLKGGFIPLTSNNAPSLIRYNVADVLILQALWRDHLAGCLDRWRADLAICQVDAAINDRGVELDRELAEGVVLTELKMRDQIAEEIAARVGETTSGDVRALLRSRVKFLDYLEESFGVILENVQSQTIRTFLEEENPDGLLRDVLLARLGETRITSAKLQRGLELVEWDDALRSTLGFCVAHTKRWAGRGLQLQNLPGQKKGVDLDASVGALLSDGTPDERVGAFLATVPESGTVSAADVLSSLTRACIKARDGREFAIVDLSNIEARGLLWEVGDEEGLDVFRNGGDPYKRAAAAIYGVPVEEINGDQRSAGKVAVLLAGYGGGYLRLGDTARSWGVDLEAAGTSPLQVVEGWRDANPLIAGHRSGRFWEGVACRTGGFWKDAQAAFIAAINGAQTELGRCLFQKWRDHVVIELPSGSALIYSHARMEEREKFGKLSPGPVYTQYKGKSAITVDTYGGKIVENISQSICTGAGGFLGEALKLLEEHFPAVLHIHDEVLVEIPRGDQDAFHQVLVDLTTPPAWAQDFPLAAAGFVSDRYRKKPPPGVEETSAYRGEVIR